jgi:hypothetical protein
VSGDGFQATALWLRTLATSAASHERQRERLRASYLSIRENATVLLGELSRSVPDFTVHDMSHVDAMWETASLICGDLVPLNPAEAYVLGCAFVFHDAAMGAAAFTKDISEVVGHSRWRDLLSLEYAKRQGELPCAADLSAPPEDIIRACTMTAIREMHASQAARLVDQPWRTSAGNDLHLVEDLQLREFYGPLIGELAASHWWNVDDLPERFRRTKGSLPWQPEVWVVEPLKLACILRIADATQVDSRRAPTFLFALRTPGGESEQHWRFQQYMGRPHLDGDRITYSSWRPFREHEVDAWWFALDYLRLVDLEMKRVDSLLHDHGKPRLAARAVAGVDSPARFVEHFPVSGWRPIDAALKVADVRALVATLGGEQMYGREPEVAVRELVQNAQDAVLARRALDVTYTGGEVTVALGTNGPDRLYLEVSDDGLGMTEEALTTILLDFGGSGWRSDTIRASLPGLAAGGFEPRGRFGIGFFSVFMLGDEVTVRTRRFDLAHGDGRLLRFRGVGRRPIVTEVAPGEPAPAGTAVRVELSKHPYDVEGLLQNTYEDRLGELVQRLVPECAVPIRVIDGLAGDTTVLPPFSLDCVGAPEVFDRLYPPLPSEGAIDEAQRTAMRAEFTRRATPVYSHSGACIGLAHLVEGTASLPSRDLEGISAVHGFRGDGYAFFLGYLRGRPNRASRDNVDLAVDRVQMASWLRSQEERMRELGVFDASMQLLVSRTFMQAFGSMADDHHVGQISTGLLTAGAIAGWVAGRDRVLLSYGWPLVWWGYPPRLICYPMDSAVQLGDGWVSMCIIGLDPVVNTVLGENRDERYAAARYDRHMSWQKRWWRMSGYPAGFFLRRLCEVWDCEIGDLLMPIEARGWSDFEEVRISGSLARQVPVLDLRRPASPAGIGRGHDWA